MKKNVIAAVLSVVSLSAWAKPQTVRLDLPTMNCAMCPITVKKALSKVSGVTDIDVSYKQKEAIVTFDDATTRAKDLVNATGNAGYPSTIKP